jgi:hypothetical protein
MNTYAVGEANLQALLTSTADESVMMILTPVAVSPRKGPPRPTWYNTSWAPDSDVGVQKIKHSVPSGNRIYRVTENGCLVF